ncbi:serine/threonine-protein phosphatase 7 [Physcomitrium patens]|uniref:Serine/threonine-protein phosphatase n=1 Tax=Physcomitrium patens TaxID=3218 RepID=A9SP25_PHYPA|nr:serine/threonine-protein phosphatase 7-like [Physcomitrium patens]PNR30937.1 hypothetical protein PHYPA_027253 [Physcomitrium patens]|eukprot:XP_024360740.1 serine/threonine-protein phosphatase 7-like [Physcomitrella patens]
MDARRVTRASSAHRQNEKSQQNEGSEEGTDPQATVMKWPENGALTLEWVQQLGKVLEFASRHLLPTELPTVLPVPVIDSLLLAAHKLLHREPNCVDVPVDHSCSVVLVGDVHGQFHDVLHLLEIAGPPSANRLFVFNGDYVDRGAWGFETYFYLLSWKLLLPHRVFLLRGNHETKFCTSAYGFEQEIMSKFGDRAKHLYRKLLGCFEGHPLAARVAGCVYMAHGGLFRQVEKEVPKKQKGKSSRQSNTSRIVNEKNLKIGTIDDLQKVRRTVLDPSGFGANVIPGDVLWSDPSPKNGLSHNDQRGIGLLFGPDCTQEFMEKHKLKLIVRSHEGPDAREKRPDMEAMNKGYTVDHVVNAGKLITLFSAPDYPQFQASEDRYYNKGAYIVLEPPDFSDPHFFQFEAVKPRPKVNPYYDFVNSIDSDEELDLGSG